VGAGRRGRVYGRVLFDFAAAADHGRFRFGGGHFGVAAAVGVELEGGLARPIGVDQPRQGGGVFDFSAHRHRRDRRGRDPRFRLFGDRGLPAVFALGRGRFVVAFPALRSSDLVGAGRRGRVYGRVLFDFAAAADHGRFRFGGGHFGVAAA